MTIHQITVNGRSFLARRGERLLDAALGHGITLPYDCRAGHCGACCVRLVSGVVDGGAGAEPGTVHACQGRIAGDAVIERTQALSVRSVEGVLASLRNLSPEVLEVGIKGERVLPHLAGQFARLEFRGFPSRPYSITLPLHHSPNDELIWFHIRRMEGGCVSPELGRRIRPGHRVTLTGPFGAAYFRPKFPGRILCVATNTGFAPIWSIAVAALREDPARRMMVIAGGRGIEALYMGPALARLAHFPNVRVVAACSSPQTVSRGVLRGRPTDYLPALLPTDVLFACGAPAMVEEVRSIADQSGAVCHADPFVPAQPVFSASPEMTRSAAF